MQKILLYYRFAPLSDPQAVKFWQRALCERLQLKGRILLSKHGINGTVGGDIDDLKAYVKETKSFAAFKGMVFKWSDGGRDDFPKLQVKVRKEIVAFDAADELNVDANGVVNGGRHLSPEAVHALVAERGEASAARRWCFLMVAIRTKRRLVSSKMLLCQTCKLVVIL
jgi:UPF0176 protein